MDIACKIWIVQYTNMEDSEPDMLQCPFTFAMEHVECFRPLYNEDGDLIPQDMIIQVGGLEHQINIPYREFLVKRDKWRKTQLVGLS